METAKTIAASPTTLTTTVIRWKVAAAASADLPSTGYLSPSGGSKGHIVTRFVRQAANLLDLLE